MRAAICLVLALGACSPAPTTPAATPSTTPAAAAYGQASGQALGTTWSLKWSPATVPADAVEAAAAEVLAQIDASMSTWRDDSELSRARGAGGPTVVSEDTADVVRAALAIAQTTDGAFEPTILPLVEMWGLKGAPRTAWPTDDEIAEARAATGWHRVVLGRSRGGPTLDVGGTALDLSAIAKGHAVDRIVHAVSGLGATDLFVEVGGEVRTTGHAPGGRPWRVGIERPVPQGAAAGLLAGVEITNGAVATSGNYRNRYELDGKVVHHTLDARTGRPATALVKSATVIAPDCRTADGWATALMVMGREGLLHIERLPETEAWLLLDGDVVVHTAGAERYVRPFPGVGSGGSGD